MPCPDLQNLFSLKNQVLCRQSLLINHVILTASNCPACCGALHLQRDILLQAVYALVQTYTIVRIIDIGKEYFPAYFLIVNQ